MSRSFHNFQEPESRLCGTGDVLVGHAHLIREARERTPGGNIWNLRSNGEYVLQIRLEPRQYQIRIPRDPR